MAGKQVLKQVLEQTLKQVLKQNASKTQAKRKQSSSRDRYRYKSVYLAFRFWGLSRATSIHFVTYVTREARIGWMGVTA